MNKTPIGLQIWSLRDAFGKDMPGTLKAIADMGYDGVELCRWYAPFVDSFDKWEAKDIRQACDDLGLKIVSSHVPYVVIEEKIPELVEFAHAVGMSFAMVASVPKENWGKREGVLAVAEVFNTASRQLAAEGIRIGYHNHDHDFHAIAGEMPWDIIFSNTDPEFVMQWDTGNAMAAGADPYLYLERYAGRSVLVHLKEYSPDNEAAAIGQGIMDWERIFDLCDRLHKPEWYIVEQEGGDAAGAMEAAKVCIDFLRGMGK